MKLSQWLSQIKCNLLTSGEHEYVYKFEPKKVRRECMHCGAQTPGWEIDKGRITSNSGNVVDFEVARKRLQRANKWNLRVAQEDRPDDSGGAPEID